MIWQDAAALLLIGFWSGLIAGAWLVARRWAYNANDYRRIEYNGRLYKVEHADGE